MPRNGSGAYAPPAGQPVISGTAISSTVFNALVTDLGNELTKSICTDGQTPMTAALPMGNNRITGLAPAVAATDAVRMDGISAALGFTPYNATNPANYTTLSAVGGSFLPLGGGNLSGNLSFANNTGLFFKDTGGTSHLTFVYSADNNLYMGMPVGGYFRWLSVGGAQIAQLDNGGGFSANFVTQTSDERKKKLWQRLPHDFVAQLANIKKSGLFTWKKGGAHGVGVGAQSLERILPTAVHTDEKGAKTVNYGAAAMVSVVELARALVAAEKMIADQGRRLVALEAK